MTSIVILAGGKGKRVKDISKGKSKPEIYLSKKNKIIDLQLKELFKINKPIYILSNVKFHTLKNHIKKKYFKKKISFLDEVSALGTSGCLKNLSRIKEDNFLIIFGDLLFNMDFQRLIKFHSLKKSDCTLVVHPNSHPYDSDSLDLDKYSRVINFYKKLHKTKYSNNLCLSGIFIINKNILKIIKKNKFQDFSKNTLPILIKKNFRIFGYETREYIKDAGTPERIKDAKKDLTSIKFKKGNLKKKIPAIFLDRDGVINTDKYDGKYQNPKNFISNSLKAIKMINDYGYLAILVTNQPAVAKGFITLRKLEYDIKFLKRKIAESNGYLDKVYFCIHHPEKGFKGEIKKYKKFCKNRKPNNGMFLSAIKELNIDVKKSFMIGDQKNDFLASKKSNIKFISVGSFKKKGILLKKNLMVAVKYIFFNKKNF